MYEHCTRVKLDVTLYLFIFITYHGCVCICTFLNNVHHSKIKCYQISFLPVFRFLVIGDNLHSQSFSCSFWSEANPVLEEGTSLQNRNRPSYTTVFCLSPFVLLIIFVASKQHTHTYLICNFDVPVYSICLLTRRYCKYVNIHIWVHINAPNSVYTHF